MRVMVVCSLNSGGVAPFIDEQILSLEKKGIECNVFAISGKGMLGYLKNFPRFIDAINKTNPDIIHAHYGLTGLFANLQRAIPVVTTYHGCDINRKSLRWISKISIYLSKYNIFVNTTQVLLANPTNNYMVLPCGVNTENFFPMEKSVAQNKLKFESRIKYVLFSSAFDNEVKNYPLAKEAIEILQSKGYALKLLELKGYSRNEVNILLNACDIALLTSKREGSPQFIKEAMATNTPIVSVDVGDVAEVIKGVEGCFLCKQKPFDIAEKIKLALSFNGKTNGREMIKLLGINVIAESLESLYNNILKKEND